MRISLSLCRIVYFISANILSREAMPLPIVIDEQQLLSFFLSFLRKLSQSSKLCNSKATLLRAFTILSIRK